MKQIRPPIRLMTPEEMRPTQLINVGSVIDMLGVIIPIAAGRTDQVHVFKEEALLYVLSVNYRFEYAGIEVFDATTGEEQESIFVDNEWNLKEYFGANWRDAAPMNIVKKFMEHMT
jgi:hypothetical protein